MSTLAQPLEELCQAATEADLFRTLKLLKTHDVDVNYSSIETEQIPLCQALQGDAGDVHDRAKIVWVLWAKGADGNIQDNNTGFLPCCDYESSGIPISLLPAMADDESPREPPEDVQRLMDMTVEQLHAHFGKALSPVPSAVPLTPAPEVSPAPRSTTAEMSLPREEAMQIDQAESGPLSKPQPNPTEQSSSANLVASDQSREASAAPRPSGPMRSIRANGSPAIGRPIPESALKGLGMLANFQKRTDSAKAPSLPVPAVTDLTDDSPPALSNPDRQGQSLSPSSFGPPRPSLPLEDRRPIRPQWNKGHSGDQLDYGSHQDARDGRPDRQETRDPRKVPREHEATRGRRGPDQREYYPRDRDRPRSSSPVRRGHGHSDSRYFREKEPDRGYPPPPEEPVKDSHWTPAETRRHPGSMNIVPAGPAANSSPRQRTREPSVPRPVSSVMNPSKAYRYPWQDPENLLYLDPRHPWNYGTVLCSKARKKGCKKQNSCTAAHSEEIYQAHKERIKRYPQAPVDRNKALSPEPVRAPAPSLVLRATEQSEVKPTLTDMGTEDKAWDFTGFAARTQGIPESIYSIVHTTDAPELQFDVYCKKAPLGMAMGFDNRRGEGYSSRFPAPFKEDKAKQLRFEAFVNLCLHNEIGYMEPVVEAIRRHNIETLEFYKTLQSMSQAGPDPRQKDDNRRSYDDPDIVHPGQGASIIQLTRPAARVSEDLTINTTDKAKTGDLRPYFNRDWAS